jgi:flagellar basal-body rod modification protein FlgD
MQVTNDPSSSASPATSAKASAPSLDYDAFLRLLIAEMQNQDPTNPIDSSQYVAQLATFSNVEQAVKMNAKLDTMMTSLALSQADGIIGHSIASADGSIVGEVVALRIVSGGAIAILSDGQELELGPGVTVA